MCAWILASRSNIAFHCVSVWYWGIGRLTITRSGSGFSPAARIATGSTVAGVLGIAIVGGRAFSMPHASKAGVVGIVLVFAAIIGYLVLPGIVRAMTGSGCV